MDTVLDELISLKRSQIVVNPIHPSDSTPLSKKSQPVEDTGLMGFKRSQPVEDFGLTGFKRSQPVEDFGLTGFKRSQPVEDFGLTGFKRSQPVEDFGLTGFKRSQPIEDFGLTGFKRSQPVEDFGLTGFKRSQPTDDFGLTGFKRSQPTDDIGSMGFKRSQPMDDMGTMSLRRKKSQPMEDHSPDLGYTPTRRPLISRGSDIWHAGLGTLANIPLTPTLSSRQRVDSNRDCQLLILGALQGIEQASETRQRAAFLVEAMDDQKKLELIDFLFAPNGVLPSTLENNACKHFECSSEELDGVLDYDTLETLLSLWEKIHQQILPNFVAMVYPLEKYDRRLQLRKKFLTFFRDKVLVKILSSLDFNPKNFQLFPLLFVIDIQTMNNSSRYWEFKDLMNKLLGTKLKISRKISILSETDSLSPLPVLRPSRASFPKYLNRQASEAVLTSGTFAAVHFRQISLNFEENTSNVLPAAPTPDPTSNPNSIPSPRRIVRFKDNIECNDDFDEESTVDV